MPVKGRRSSAAGLNLLIETRRDVSRHSGPFSPRFSPVSRHSADFSPSTRHFLAIYELNDLRILQKVFIRAYERSAERYTVIRGAVGDPDPFRVRYRQAIADQVAEIIRSRCDRREAVACLRQ